ncbi:helix-turn-helix domain-containing protein [Nonomuraea sp. NPDC049714]|uniref:helix-turn-helix domain-containing protein n=1 Tax=Nonomuraea sp. NPDC049714 TaxID=3364357 RepID=UPI003795BEEA
MPSVSVLQLDDVPARERFDFWWQAVAESVVSVDATSDRAGDFWAEMRTLDLGMVQLSQVRCVSFDARRGASHIRRSDADLYQLAVTVQGRSGLCQNQRDTRLEPGDLVLYDTARSFLAWTVSEGPNAAPSQGRRGEVAEGMILRFPHQALPLPVAMVEPLLAVPLPGRDGVGSLLAGLLHRLIAQPEWSACDLTRLSTILLDLVAALLGQRLDEDASAFQADPHHVLILRIKAFIEERLGDPELTPSIIAAGHYISVRQLHKLFQNAELTVGGWIRERRLERCRRDLANPLMAHLPVGTIATHWGFASQSHFNRVFQQAYDASPAMYRRLVREHGSSAP